MIVFYTIKTIGSHLKMNFSIEQRVEAVDQVGIWSPGQIIAR